MPPWSKAGPPSPGPCCQFLQARGGQNMPKAPALQGLLEAAGRKPGARRGMLFTLGLLSPKRKGQGQHTNFALP